MRDPTSSRFAASLGQLGWPPLAGSYWKRARPIDNTMEYNTVVGDHAGGVTHADLVNVFRNPNLDLRGDSPYGPSSPSIYAAIQRPWLTRWNARRRTETETETDGRDGSGFCHRNGGK